MSNNLERIISKVNMKKQIGDDHFYFKVNRHDAQRVIDYFKNQGDYVKVTSGTYEYACIIIYWDTEEDRE